MEKTRFCLFVFTTLILHLILPLRICYSQWLQIPNGIGNDKIVFALAVKKNSGDTTIYAGTHIYGVYKTTNRGLNWIQTSLNSSDIYSLEVVRNTILAGAAGGIKVSTNDGNNWILTSSTLVTASSFAVKINFPDTLIFAGNMGQGEQGVLISTNKGMNWSQTSLINREVTSLLIRGDYIFAGTIGYGIYISTNNGLSWEQTIIGNNESINSLASTGDYIFSGDWEGIKRSSNNGANWIQTSFNYRDVKCIITNGSQIYAGHDRGIEYSPDYGITWYNKNQGLNPDTLTVWDLIISNDYIYAGTNFYSVWRRQLTDIINVKKISTCIPLSFSLSQNYPNPFNPSTKIRFEIPNGAITENEKVTLKVFDATGKEILTLINEKLSAGIYETRFDATNIPSGVYFYKITAGKFSSSMRMILLK